MMTNGKKLYAQVGVHITDAELIDKGEELAQMRLESTRLTGEKADHTATFKATDEYKAYKEANDAIGDKIASIETEADELAKQIDAREKVVDIEVREEADLARNMIVTIAVDGKQAGQVIGKPRPMTLNELAEARQAAFERGETLGDSEPHDTEPPPADVDAGEEAQEGREKLVKLDPKARRAQKLAAAAEKAAE